MPRRFLNELGDSLDSKLTYSNRLLGQFTNSGISAYVVNFSRIAHTNYKSSTTGERIFNYCLTNLQVYAATDENLQFGWSETCIWRNLDLHQYEYEHLLLVSAVAECLPDAYAGAILSCLATKYEDGDRVKSSLAEWTALARSLDGLLSTSDFALMIDDRMRLDPYRVTSGHATSCTNSLIAPTEFANALQALSDLSIAETGQLTLVGGNFLGWFAAFSELFLGINVHISSRDGEVLYATHTDSKATLRLIFVDDVNNLTPTPHSQDNNFTALTVMCSADAEANTVPRVPFTGRVSWESLLPKTFEACFHRIAHQDSRMFVQSVGGLARIFQLLAQDPETPETLISKDNRSNAGALGMGLIQTLGNWFPELRHLQGRLERLQTLSTIDEAANKCDEGAHSFVDACGCTICYSPWYCQGKEDTGKLPQSFCLLAMMETILNLGLAMSRITVVSKLYPSRAGVLCMYQRQVQKLLDAKRDFNTEGVTKWSRMTKLFGRDWSANPSRRLQNAAAIFSGSWPEKDLPENLVAMSHEGICVNILGTQYSDKRATRRQDADVVRVQPGHIAWKQKIYSRACLGAPRGISEPDYTWEVAHCGHLSQDLYCK